MKLFTITATPYHIRNKREKNESLVACYPSNVSEILAKHGIDGFTMYQVMGYWKGRGEPSFKIEIAIDSDSEKVYTVARELRRMYNQDAVMLTLPNNTVKFIED